MAQEKKEEQPQQDHIPTSPQNEEEEQSKGSGGLLSAIGDPVGNVLNTALRPVGAPLEKFVTGPLGEGLGGTTRGALGPLMGHEDERSELLGGKNVDSYSKPEKIAGKEQTGDNPLGLDQTGRWGFEDEGKK
ncbi:hypothetical protein COCC4DRAFT_52803 [Bipolaris maydis ATCC 48331]|uniref:Uncharacterized protein n=2 Tax=Cochliobolus heterostrophus TaxID=5016 RepID=M2TBN6_COCH5|nr:uncharacterized protein COCC4DRAFT_52803 [Bipolaris maydis ATCC 48331]EMD94960.1 hypothetical protein COCHEDRAFT_1168380 [Bipolaris maydis C5]KAH7555859.1 hypothetical protein BM1_06385 [Bipolaris maydis]ENI01749.1 hypothetical protein COCC4DRAFT_52803 [Bipolaris maydis ATCC 48331]KAJ5029354.1 hypothetical protein J3E73DRAFT_421268 [Bipolaris maydis]KAJ5061904.1 hypothetical protein J3E74DRAFT_417294 [Bipolaris maydis]